MSFPIINNISQVLPALAEKPEFSVVEKDGYTYIDYRLIDNHTFEDPNEEGISKEEQRNRSIRLECRGIKFDANGNIICRPWQKFFNTGEHPWVYPSPEGSGLLLEKLDGSLIAAYRIDDKIYYGTKAGHDTEVAQQLVEFLKTHPEYDEFSEICINAGFTPIFEWLSPRNQIVVPHTEDMLVVTGIRHMVAGHYIPYDTMAEYCRMMNVPVVGCSDIPAEKKDEIFSKEGLEGYVLRHPNGYMEKIKTEWYLKRHKARAGLVWEKDVIRMILDGSLDDVIQFFEEHEVKRINEYRDLLVAKIAYYTKFIFIAYKERIDEYGTDRKAFALSVSGFNPGMKSWLFSLYGKEANDDLLVPCEDIVKQYILKNTTSSSKIATAREIGLLPDDPWKPMMFSFEEETQQQD